MQLLIPGPTPYPPEALEPSGRQMINHGGKEFFALIQRVTDGRKAAYQTKNDLFILTGSGTGGLEAAVVNTLSPGDRVLSTTCRVYSDRFADITEVMAALDDVVPRARRGGQG
jgi:aspartate aminotransferase-like enzyme